MAVVLLVVIYGWQKKQISDGTGADVSEPVELELVYAYQNAQWNSAIEKTVADFNETHPDIRVVYQIHYENKVYENILNTLIARDELGDIVQLKTPKAYVDGGILGEIPKEILLEKGVNSTYVADGKLYGVGAVNATSGIIYNKDLFETYQLQEPETYQEFLALCSAIRRLGITPVGVGGSDLWHMEYWVNHFLRSDILYMNGNWFTQCRQGETSWQDEEVTLMLTHLQQLFSDGRVDQNWLSTPDGGLAYMMSEGEVAMIYSGAWVCEEILRLNPDMELGWFYVPDENGKIQVDENQDTFWSVTKECQEDEAKYQAAMTFLEFFYSDENYANVRKSITAFPTATDYKEYDMNDVQSQIRQDFEDNRIHITGYIGDENCPQGFEIHMLIAVQEMLAGDRNIAQTQQKIQDMWEKCLRQEVEGP